MDWLHDLAIRWGVHDALFFCYTRSWTGEHFGYLEGWAIMALVLSVSGWVGTLYLVSMHDDPASSRPGAMMRLAALFLGWAWPMWIVVIATAGLWRARRPVASGAVSAALYVPRLVRTAIVGPPPKKTGGEVSIAKAVGGEVSRVKP